MQTFMKATFAAALSIAAISPAIAGEDPIVVQSQAAMTAWQDDVARSLDRRLAKATQQTRVIPVEGVVQLRFTLDAYGKPSDIEVYSSSGDQRTDFVAKRAVRGLAGLNEAPVDNAAERTFQANIIFADNVDTQKKLAMKLAASEKVRLAQSDSEGSVISFGL